MLYNLPLIVLEQNFLSLSFTFVLLFALFRKYYKRYYARTKVNQINPDKFREWNYKACEMRDRCQNGEITPQEFEEWLYGSFKNRAKKDK
ncbi:MAG: hypothetical protein IJ740_11985 [Ruminococcus sp.]|nr:hypothetical protein [Ruminococcus sp.]